MVREAVFEDLDALLGLDPHLHETAVPDKDDRLMKTWAGILADDNHHVVVDEQDGELVASCVCVVVPNLTRGARPYALVENVVTHAAHRRQGHARACLDRAREIARQAGCYKIMLMTGSKSEGTLEFYRSCGYSDAEKTAFVQRL